MRIVKIALTLICLSLIVSTAGAQEWTAKSFQEKIGEIFERQEAITLCRQACETSDDIDLLMVVQDNWLEIDKDGATKYFTERMTGKPESARGTYLFGRTLETGLEKVKCGRRVIGLDPDWSSGYRLLMSGYSSDLFNAEEPVERLDVELSQDQEIFTRYATGSDQDWAARYLMEYHLHQGEYDQALTVIEAGAATKARWASPLSKALVQVYLGKIELARETTNQFIGSLVAGGRVDESDRAEYSDYYFLSTLRKAEAWQTILDFYEGHPVQEGAEQISRHYDLACCYALMGKTDAALTELTRAVDTGFSNRDNMETDSDLNTLHGSKKWRKLLKRVTANHAKGAEKRRSEILGGKFERPAPDWSLRDPQGNTVSLGDLRGEVLVLDFWATWCSPCRMAMPVLDTWMKKEMPKGVRVFSINVWESKPVAAASFIADNDYRMELLYGSNELAQSYGVTGIPYLCVIDGQGMIRFEETGYSPELKENLAIWAADLLQP
jgi:thiol-disulfide isomerase/thioredoxin